MHPADTLSDNSVVCLMAPTASGKTALAYELYDTGRFELISVDSALIYRDMNIGTAKPTTAELQRYPHHLVDIIDPTETYSVAQFVSDVRALIDQAHAAQKIPLLVGGTMMYYMALLDGLSAVPDSDAEVRARVDAWRQAEGIGALYAYLERVDPTTHQRLNDSDTQRITRAVEVHLQTQVPLSEWQRTPKQRIADNPEQVWHNIAVMPDRAWLHQRIAQRLDIMWQEGLVDEVLTLLNNYSLTPNMAAMRCVGYRQVLEYLVAIRHPIFDAAHLDKAQFYEAFLQTDEANIITDKESTLFQKNSESVDTLSTEAQALACYQMQNKALYATRQLAKRQYTWLRKIGQLPSGGQEGFVHSNTAVMTVTQMSEAADYLRRR
ncbi:tRNA (adenosine(37)-N6)-dimethylallyltransferase MiaA [Psychrobacter aestuarii]|uniref:tRNA dimethylallyltransferase n=1 Tax=Psychrobacter aestuarii TaxID=556327 RepID=A0ABN0VNQ3_9GAMM|nr:tRNA (adenosine(37)-N6)-dimethylallyltransferase MiaA [Psychrobacter aestuarii]